MNKFMEIAKNKSISGFKNEEGGPFGAVIIDKDENVIAEGNNKVLCNNDPTAHAEIVAIRNACEKADLIFTVSNSAKNDIVAKFPKVREKIHAIWLGL